MSSESASNTEQWKLLHEQGYFRNHPCYDGGIRDTGWFDVKKFEEMYGAMSLDGVLAVIGCGYGRETKHFLSRVKTVYGIDVSPTVLQQAEAFVRSPSFIPVLASEYKTVVPDVDYVYSHSVFQHIPHEITIDYIETFKAKVKPGGAILVQFVQHRGPDKPVAKPEPVYSWNADQIKALFGGGTRLVTETIPLKQSLAHFVCWRK